MGRVSLAFGVALLAGCGVSARISHDSPLLSIRTEDTQAAGKLGREAAWYEDVLVLMAGHYQVALEDVVPVRVHHRGGTGKSHYNRLTRTIVLCGPPDRAAFVHELSHLLAHRVRSSPPYWADQALAEYMEARLAEAPRDPWSRPDPRGERRGERTRHLLRRMAQERDAAEVLAHLSREAVDEDRSWGLILVRWLFEELWAGLPSGEKVRRLLHLREEEVEELAPRLLEYCRRSDLLAGPAESAGR